LLLELELIGKLNSSKPAGEKTIFHVIKPEFPLPLDPDLMFNKINADELINRGYADAKSYLQRKTELGVAPDYKASLMNEPGSVLVFRSLFSEMIDWKNEQTEFSLNVNFNLRSITNELVLRAFASVSFGNSENRISTYNNQVMINQTEQILTFECDFVFEDQIQHLHGQLDLISPYDLLLGMEFKRARCTITGKNLPKPISAVLKQNAWIRIKNVPFIHVSSSSGLVGKWKEKFWILGEVYKQK